MVDDGNAQGATTRPTAFLSYSHADQARVRQLADALELAGVTVWWDTLLEGGAEFARSVEVALARCDAVVVAWSKVSIDSNWVRDEASQGRDLRKLVPVSLDGSLPPLGFRQFLAVDLSGWSGEVESPRIASIVRGIEAVMGRAPTAPPAHGMLHAPAPTGAAESRFSRRTALLAGLGVLGAAAAGSYAWRLARRDTTASGIAGNSVAVLPFKNLSGDSSQDYFSDGLSEELRSTLARNLRLQVMAQASSAKFRDRADDAVTIAAKLGVAYLLDGAVRKAGDVVRVTTDLVDGRTGFSRWSQTFERSLQDIFAVQTEVAETVARALTAAVAPAPGAASVAAAGGTRNPAAYDAYLRGRALYDLSVDEASERAALAQFDAAIAADPQFAPAHAARARSLTAIANQYGATSENGNLYQAAIESAERAIELAPQLAESYSTLGFTLFQARLDAAAAREPFERSRELGAGEATVLARFAQYCARTGRDADATEAIRRALVLDKFNPLIHRAAASIEFAARRYAASIPPARESLRMNPRLSRVHAAIGDALLLMGRLDEARKEYGLETARGFGLTGLAIVEHKLGRADAARQARDELVRSEGDRMLYQQAQVAAQWGEPEQAVVSLQRALIIGDGGLVYARNDPFLDPLRSDPRFAQLLKRMGFA